MDALNPLNNSRDILRLQQKLLALHPRPDHILPLQIIIPQPALRALQRVRSDKIRRLGWCDR